ncbi:hypothetical protein CSKR_104273 [Clonorchis sinensis]|uniref:Uncharacterized protein n=1 Tax=Clonorchis sinensis TaxID=79923 RepID=A0A419QD05_CLOSI|nr:hypothetical protein CSKR_104273 [Clonorchis sinensis]
MLPTWWVWRDGSSANLLTARSVVRTPPLPLDFPCLGLGNLAVSQSSGFLRAVAGLVSFCNPPFTLRGPCRNKVYPLGRDCLEREFTDRKVRGLNPTSTSRLFLSRLWQPGSIPPLVLPSDCMAAKHRNGIRTERFLLLLLLFTIL